MYTHVGANETFILNYGKDWGNTVVYGALFAISDFNYYISLLDAYHQCSMSNFGLNHPKDIHHREIRKITPITFDTIDELERIKYRENVPIDAHVYFGNVNHPKINQRLNKTVSYRVVDGIDKHFIQLYREVETWNKQVTTKDTQTH